MEKLYFGASKGKSLTSKLIRFWQGGAPYTHVFYVVNIFSKDLRIIEAWKGGVRKGMLSFSHKSGTEYIVFSIDVTKEQKHKFDLFIRSQIGKKYDFLGVLGVPLRLPLNTKDRWFCTELLLEGFKYAGIRYFDYDFLTTNIMTPQNFLLNPNKEIVLEGRSS